MNLNPARSIVSRLAGIAALSAANSGCGGPAQGPVPLHPAEGRVLAAGKPLADVRVIFRPAGADGAGSTLVPVGTTDAEGKFRLSTAVDEGRLSEGAPAGDYEVAISPPARSDSGGFLGKPIAKGPDSALAPGYSDPKTSGLKATIKAGDNTIGPFDLKSAGAGAPRPASDAAADGRSR